MSQSGLASPEARGPGNSLINNYLFSWERLLIDKTIRVGLTLGYKPPTNRPGITETRSW